jgi:nucleoside-diphosphate-sugar epimerase
MNRVVITGSAGLIGGHLAREIERCWPDAFVQRVDLKDGHNALKFFANNDDRDWDVAFHMAAITGGIEGTMFNGAFQASHNSQLDGAYFEWALRVRPQRIVYTSSSCAYPVELSHVQGRGLREDDIDFAEANHDPDQPYGWAKLNGEVMANAVRDSGIPVSIVRPFAIVGETQENCRMIPAFIERAASDDECMEVWGPGDQASDFVHVSDCVNALLALVDQGIDVPVNIGTGRGAPADEVAELVMAEVGVKKDIVHNLDKPYGPRWRVANPTLLESIYKPQMSLEETVARIVAAQR